jgi:hypothetical protein
MWQNLFKITEKGRSIRLEEGRAEQNAFQTLKELLDTAPLLQYPDFTRSFIIITDA